MAMQAGLRLLLVGAGVGGSTLIWIFSKLFSDLLPGLSDRVSYNFTEVLGEELSSGSDGNATAALTEEVVRLTMEYRQALAASNRPFILAKFPVSLLLTAAVIGVAGYGLMRWTGWPDRRSRAESSTVTTERPPTGQTTSQLELINRSLEANTAAIDQPSELINRSLEANSAAIHQLSELINRSLVDNTGATNAIHTQTGAGSSRETAGEVAERVSELNDVDYVDGLERRIHDVALLQDQLNTRIHLLCQFVLEHME